MDQDTRDSITWFLATAISLTAIVAGLVKFVLLPYVREHLVAPMVQVRKQVTENAHENKEPTVLDRIDDVHRSIRALTRVMDNHLEWSDRWVDVIEREIDLVKRNREEQKP